MNIYIFILSKNHYYLHQFNESIFHFDICYIRIELSFSINIYIINSSNIYNLKNKGKVIQFFNIRNFLTLDIFDNS